MKLRKYAAGAAVIGAYLALGTVAHAQFSTPEYVDESSSPDPAKPRQTYTNVFGISPRTTFQFTVTDKVPGGNGSVETQKFTEQGPMVFAEKTFLLRKHVFNDTRHIDISHIDYGAWYWASTDKSTHHDISNLDDYKQRYALYAKYFYNHRVGGQISMGGNRQGFIEYYGFLLYNVAIIGNRGAESIDTPSNSADAKDAPASRGSSAGDRSNVGLQLGIGPYFPRRELGNAGYTAFASAGYRFSDRFTANASYWYLNYTRSQNEFGITKSNGLNRVALSLVYTSP